MIPYGRQSIDEEDIKEVVQVLRSKWLTTGPKVAEFEEAFAQLVGAPYAVAVINGTAALHSAVYALGLGPGDEVLVPAMTFAASANCVVYQGATPIFVDVDPHTLLLDPAQVEAKLTQKTRAIMAVDYAGHPCDYDRLRALAHRQQIPIIADACHALGADYKGRPVGTLGDLNAFSFHPVKPITTGEGGIITTHDPDLAGRMRVFRNHGITTDHRQREQQGSWFYEMQDLGHNYRLTDLQCALGLSQLRKLTRWVSRRREIACRYDEALAGLPAVAPLTVRPYASHAYHLYVVQLELERLRGDRAQVYLALRAEGIGVNIHYIPVNLHPFYRNRFGTKPGDCPIAEAAYQRLLTIPIFPTMRDEEVEAVIAAILKICKTYRK
jgi:perosamine synthetase